MMETSEKYLQGFNQLNARFKPSTIMVCSDPESCFIKRNTYRNKCVLCRSRDQLDNNLLTSYVSKLKLYIFPLNLVALDAAQYTAVFKSKMVVLLFSNQGSKEHINSYFLVSGKTTFVLFNRKLKYWHNQ